MATVSQTKARCRDFSAIRRANLVEITGPASYVAGGDSCPASDVLLGLVEYFPDCTARNAALAVYTVFYDYDNEKLVWVVPTTGAEVAAGVDLSGYKFRAVVEGK